MSAVRTLVGLEMREAMPAAAAAACAFAVAPVLPFLLSPDLVADAVPSLAVLLGLPLAAAALGGPAVAGERAEGTWAFLRARPVSEKRLLIVKLAVRATLALGVAIVALLAVRAWCGPSPWLELADLPYSSGLRLGAALSVTAFLAAFLSGERLDDPVVATLGGALAGAVLVAVVLVVGVALGGSGREAATLSSGSWISARRILAGRGLIGSPAQVAPSEAAVAFEASAGKETSRVAVVFVEPHGGETFVSSPSLLERGTQLLGWEDAATFRVRWPDGSVRAVGLDGRTRRASDAPIDAARRSAEPRDGALWLGSTRVYPRHEVAP